MITTYEMLETIENRKARSAWERGVKRYAILMVEDAGWAVDREHDGDWYGVDSLEELLLNGASDWSAYSWGGCALVYDTDIAELLCTPSELKRKRGGVLPPNGSEEWLDVQARACYQAYLMAHEALLKLRVDEKLRRNQQPSAFSVEAERVEENAA